MAEEKTQEDLYKLVLHKSKYIVSKFSLNGPDFPEMVDLIPQSIRQIYIIQDFDNCIQPIFQIQVTLPPLVIDYINTHKSDVSFYLRFKEIDYMRAEENYTVDNAPYNTNGSEDICNGLFILFSADVGRVENLSSYQKATEIITGEKNIELINNITGQGANFKNYTKEYQFFIWKEDDLYNLRTPVNAVFNNVTLGDVAAGILSSNGFKNILMAPPDNTTSFGQLIVPPQNMMNVFSYLQRQYGMYDTDVILFSDINRTYVLDKSGECKAYEENEYQKMIFSVVRSDSEDAQSVGSCTIDEKKEYHTKLDIANIYVRSLSTVHDIIKGNVNKYIDSKNNEITTVSGAGMQRGAGCVNITVDRESTEYTKKRQTNTVSEMNIQIKINILTDYKYLALSPNKSFIFSFKDKDFYELNGYYRLIKAKHFFTREGAGDRLNISGEFEFVRKKALSEEERAAIEYDVFKTAQASEEETAKAESKADENNANDPSYQQSQDNQVKEGKQEAPKTTTKGSETPKDLSPNVYEYNKISPNDDLGVINAKLIAQKKQLDAEKTTSKGGSPAPTPLDEKNKK